MARKTRKPGEYGTVIAHRKDGLGYMLGRLVAVGKRHGHRVYHVRSTVSGAILTLSALQYNVVAV